VNIYTDRLFAREPEMKSIVSISSIDEINMLDLSLRFPGTRSKQNQMRNSPRDGSGDGAATV
jgi:hypothetical protein